MTFVTVFYLFRQFHPLQYLQHNLKKQKKSSIGNSVIIQKEFEYSGTDCSDCTNPQQLSHKVGDKT